MNPDYEWQIADMVTILKELKRFKPEEYRITVLEFCAMARGEQGNVIWPWPSDWVERCVNNLKQVVPPTTRSYQYPGYSNDYFVQVLRHLREI